MLSQLPVRHHLRNAEPELPWCRTKHDCLYYGHLLISLMPACASTAQHLHTAVGCLQMPSVLLQLASMMLGEDNLHALCALL